MIPSARRRAGDADAVEVAASRAAGTLPFGLAEPRRSAPSAGALGPEAAAGQRLGLQRPDQFRRGRAIYDRRRRTDATSDEQRERSTAGVTLGDAFRQAVIDFLDPPEARLYE